MVRGKEIHKMSIGQLFDLQEEIETLKENETDGDIIAIHDSDLDRLGEEINNKIAEESDGIQKERAFLQSF